MLSLQFFDTWSVYVKSEWVELNDRFVATADRLNQPTNSTLALLSVNLNLMDFIDLVINLDLTALKYKPVFRYASISYRKYLRKSWTSSGFLPQYMPTTE